MPEISRLQASTNSTGSSTKLKAQNCTKGNQSYPFTTTAWTVLVETSHSIHWNAIPGVEVVLSKLHGLKAPGTWLEDRVDLI